jgi:hypothetical protein
MFTQHQIAATVPPLAYVPARLAIGWHYERWTHAGALRIFFANKAGREIALGPDRFADVGLGRIAASGHRIR